MHTKLIESTHIICLIFFILLTEYCMCSLMPLILNITQMLFLGGGGAGGLGGGEITYNSVK